MRAVIRALALSLFISGQMQRRETLIDERVRNEDRTRGSRVRDEIS